MTIARSLLMASSPKGALTWVGYSTGYGETVTLPTHQAGDLLIILAKIVSGNVTVPAGWTALTPAARMRAGYRLATAAGTLSGDWGYETTRFACFVWRGARPQAPVGAVGYRFAADFDLIIPAVTCELYGSWIVSLAMSDDALFTSGGSPTTLPGMTLRYNASSMSRAWDSNGPMASLAQQTRTTSADNFLSLSLEVKV